MHTKVFGRGRHGQVAGWSCFPRQEAAEIGQGMRVMGCAARRRQPRQQGCGAQAGAARQHRQHQRQRQGPLQVPLPDRAPGGAPRLPRVPARRDGPAAFPVTVMWVSLQSGRASDLRRGERGALAQTARQPCHCIIGLLTEWVRSLHALKRLGRPRADGAQREDAHPLQRQPGRAAGGAGRLPRRLRRRVQRAAPRSHPSHRPLRLHWCSL
jgi:hypothetical protein